MQSASTDLTAMCDQGSTVQNDRGLAAQIQDNAPTGVTDALTCSVNRDAVTIFVFDNTIDAQQGLASIASGNQDVVASDNWVAGINDLGGIGSSPGSTAQQVQQHLGGSINP